MRRQEDSDRACADDVTLALVRIGRPFRRGVRVGFATDGAEDLGERKLCISDHRQRVRHLRQLDRLESERDRILAGPVLRRDPSLRRTPDDLRREIPAGCLFGEAVGVTGVALTKLDGSAKGGIAVAIAHELGLPVKLVGVGETLEDLRPFDADDFARALVAG